MLTQKELINQFYLNQAQVGRLLGINQYKAKVLYDKADELDNQQLDFRLEENKVRTRTVLKIAGVSYDELKKRVG